MKLARLEEKISELIEFACKNNNSCIRYNVAVDILKDKDNFSEEEILGALGEITDRGITILAEVDEGYPAEETSSETFIPAEVNITQKPVNVYNLMERLENEEIDLKPNFQRSADIWTLEQQSRLIESLILKIPIPAFYFNAADDDCWIVIDGLQRLTAFLNFLVGVGQEKVKKKFIGLQYLKDFNGHTFDELPRQYVRRIKETPVVAYTVEKGTPDEIVFNIFQRINTGGIVLTAQEIRQALYQGKVTDMIERLVKTEEFQKATQGAIYTKRMLDKEYVTRFIAFTELNYREEYKGNIDSYLIKAMKTVNNYGEGEIVRIEKNFRKIMFYCAEIFGRLAFRKYYENGRRGPINKAIFEMWAVCFSELSKEQLDRLVGQKDKILKGFFDLQQNQGFVAAIKGGSQYSTIARIDMARNFIKEFL